MNTTTIINLPGEIWKECIDYPLYSVSNKGRVKRNQYERFVILGGFLGGTGTIIYYPEKLLTPTLSKNGYLKVTLQRDRKMKTESVHRLVAKAFIPNPHGYKEVNHKDENKLNNCADNLEWVSSEYNLKYGTRLERISKTKTGQKRPPLTAEHKKKLAESLKGKNAKKVISKDGHFTSAREAAEYYKVVYSTFRNWLNGTNPMPDNFKKMGLRYQ